MTEQQINNLKKLLASSRQNESPIELDERILNTARSHAPVKEGLFSQWFGLMPFGSIGAAALSVALTAVAFLAMSQLVSVNNILAPPIKSEIIITHDNKIETTKQIDSKKIAMSRVKPPTSLLNTTKTRDEILANINLPNVESLLDDMKFSIKEDRLIAANNLIIAMSDINLMIQDGELDNARERYKRLRKNCEVCQLPMTLDALALAEQKIPSRI